MGGLLGAAIGGLARLFVRKVTTTNEDTGEDNTKRQATPFGKASLVILGCALLYHYIVWPIINYHFPQYGFQDIDSFVLSVISGIGM